MQTPMYVLVAIGFLVLIAASVRRIPEGQAYTLRRFGGHLRTIGAGTHLVLPLFERIAHRIRLLGNVANLERIGAPSGLQYGAQVYYQILDAERADAIIDDVDGVLRRHLPGLIEPPLEAAAGDRNARVKAELNALLKERGILVTRVQIATP